MRLCRFLQADRATVGLYDEQGVVALHAAALALHAAAGRGITLPQSDNLLDFLPPNGTAQAAAQELSAWAAEHPESLQEQRQPLAKVQLLVPIPRPNKLFLLAGNYAEHIAEGGGLAAEREQTFPYVFMKPPTTTLTNPGAAVRIPSISPDAIDWELELGVIIGSQCKGVSAAEALRHVAGYTVINDISNRRFRPNPQRTKREKDSFFDWLHGKWFDSFCPCGPCVLSAADLPDPQGLRLELKLNGQTQQDASTGQMIFSVAQLIEFISSMVTLEPGDIISTGTPAGVGAAKGLFLKPGDVLEASIESIGKLTSPVVAE